MAQLAGLAMALESVPVDLWDTDIKLLASSQSALKAIAEPRQQSGQTYIKRIHRAAARAREQGVTIEAIWIPSKAECDTLQVAKTAAKQATNEDERNIREHLKAKSTIKKELQKGVVDYIPSSVGRFSRQMDAALPGKHTKTIYDACTAREARVLVQLRTGKTRLNSYLHKIGVAEKASCECGVKNETVEHFLFTYLRWRELREAMREHANGRYGDLFFFLGGRSAQTIEGRIVDPQPWKPSKATIKTTIKFAIKTGRLEQEPISLDTALQ